MISIISIIQMLCWIYYLVILGMSGYYISLAIILAGMFWNFVLNLTTFILYKTSYRNDYEFKPFTKLSNKAKCVILTISLTCSHRFFHFTMSGFGSSLSSILKPSEKKFKIVNIVSFFCTDLLIFIAAIINLSMTNTAEQSFFTSLEVQ